jgi:hypothetical protein
MDIEGAEYEVIDSWTKEDVKGIQIFLIEFHNNVPQNLVDKFLKWGYTVSPYDASGNEIEMYGIWVNEIQIPDHGFLTAINMH